jgi:hypothetical protein
MTSVIPPVLEVSIIAPPRRIANARVEETRE